MCGATGCFFCISRCRTLDHELLTCSTVFAPDNSIPHLPTSFPLVRQLLALIHPNAHALLQFVFYSLHIQIPFYPSVNFGTSFLELPLTKLPHNYSYYCHHTPSIAFRPVFGPRLRPSPVFFRQSSLSSWYSLSRCA